MIPDLVQLRDVPHGVLPPGVHWATLAQIEARFATSEHRRWLFEGLIEIAAALKRAGCRTMYVGGSFVTTKETPGDFDGCWDPTNVQERLLDPVLLKFDDERAGQKWAYRGEMFVSIAPSGHGGTYFEFLQMEKETGQTVGLIGVRLRFETGIGP